METTLMKLENRIANLERLIIQSSKETFTVQECADYLGCSKRHIYNLVSQNKIAYYKPEGGNVYFSKNDIEEFVRRNRFPSQRELKARANLKF